MKKVLSLLLALCLLIGAVPMFAFASDSDFVIEDGVIKEYVGPGGAIVIPDTVRIIRKFRMNPTITEVTIPGKVSEWTMYDDEGNITQNNVEAFAYCENLTKVTIQEGCKVLTACMFGYCEKLTTLYLPSTLTYLGSAFADCTAIKDIYYNGTEEQWKKVEILPICQGIVDSATIHFKTDSTTPSTGFTDVKPSAYYAEAVKWAVENGITSGIGGGKFAPENTCKREQIVTFLYRSKGSPEVTVTGSFTDMPKNQEFQRAISWAVENNITSGVGGGRFAPEKGCTRAEAMTFIWRAAGRPEPNSEAEFKDMPQNSDFRKAISWAYEKEITNGVGDGTRFGTNQTCTRGQIVTFLYKAREL